MRLWLKVAVGLWLQYWVLEAFEDGYVTIELSFFQCVDIAQACHFASEYSFDEKIDEWRTLVALFQACIAVGFTQRHMSKSELEAVFEHMTELNLGRYHPPIDRQTEHHADGIVVTGRKYKWGLRHQGHLVGGRQDGLLQFRLDNPLGGGGLRGRQ